MFYGEPLRRRAWGDAAVMEGDQHALGLGNESDLVVLFLEPVPRRTGGAEDRQTDEGVGHLGCHHERRVAGAVVEASTWWEYTSSDPTTWPWSIAGVDNTLLTRRSAAPAAK